MLLADTHYWDYLQTYRFIIAVFRLHKLSFELPLRWNTAGCHSTTQICSISHMSNVAMLGRRCSSGGGSTKHWWLTQTVLQQKENTPSTFSLQLQSSCPLTTRNMLISSRCGLMNLNIAPISEKPCVSRAKMVAAGCTSNHSVTDDSLQTDRY